MIAVPRMKGVAPAILIGIGLLHCAVGINQGWPTLTAIIRAGVWDSVEGAGADVFLWFMTAGIFLIFLGQLGFWVERRLDSPLPAFLGWEVLLFTLVAGSAVGDLLFPAVLFFAAAIIILVRARGHARAAALTN